MTSMIVSEEARVATFINVWSTPSRENQEKLVQAMKSEVSEITRKPGFISMAILPSSDGKQVVVFGQWRSQEDFDAGVANDEKAMANRRALATYGEPSANLYRVDSVFAADES